MEAGMCRSRAVSNWGGDVIMGFIGFRILVMIMTPSFLALLVVAV